MISLKKRLGSAAERYIKFGFSTRRGYLIHKHIAELITIGFITSLYLVTQEHRGVRKFIGNCEPVLKGYYHIHEVLFPLSQQRLEDTCFWELEKKYGQRQE